MLLSIGMMVKNEEKYLDRCLISLNPILKKLDCELIIVDTGSTDNTVEIAQKYTNKIYFHQWNNNFSEMRNITLNYCSGNWFFCIDGDEVLENCDDILSFFESKIFKKYNSASIYVKNLVDLKDETNFSIFSSLRLFKKDKEFKYINAVHNQPVFKEPIRVLSTNCKHYGYISSDGELMERKFERTTIILKSEIEKDPSNIYYLNQLSVSYGMHKEYDKAVQYIQTAYDNLIYKKEDIKKYLYIYPQLCLSYFNVKDYVKVKKYANECLKYENHLIDIYYYLGIASMMLKENKEAISSLESFLENYENYYTTEKNISVIDYTLGRINEAYFSLYLLNREIKEYEKAKKYLLQIKDEKHNISKNILDLCITTREYYYIKQYEEQLFLNDNKNEMEKLYFAIENEKLKLNDDIVNLFNELFSHGSTFYNYLNEIRLDYINKKNIDIDLIYSLLGKMKLTNQPFYFADLIYYLIISELDISNLLSDLSFIKINEYLVYLSTKFKDFSESLYNYILEFTNNEDINSVRINKELCRYIILLNKLDRDKLVEIYKLYIELGVNYIEYVYSKFVLESERCQDVRTEEEMFFIYMNKAKIYKSNDTKLYIQYLRKSLEVYSYMKDVVEFLLDEEEKSMGNENNEFEQYKIKIKSTMKSLIENGDFKDVEVLIKEYESIVNNDVEIVLFKSQMALKNMNTSQNYM